MKKTKFKMFFFLLFALSISGYSQNLDRVTLSSGGVSNDGISATIGELFVFSINGSGISLDAGGQSDVEETGGIPSLTTSVSSVIVQNAKVLVYPNPVAEVLNLQINGLNSETVAFQIFDVLGTLVLQQTKTSAYRIFKIEVSQLKSGNYFIKGYSVNGENIGEIKFIKL